MKGPLLWTLTSVVPAVCSEASLAYLQPAATRVTVSPSGAPSRFPAETVQLTDGVLEDVAAAVQNETISNMFAFGDSPAAASVSKRSLFRRACKLMPGDLLWPSEWIWRIFDLLLGDRLIEAVPLAAYCYRDWSQYDEDKCKEISKQWTNSDLHMGDPTSIMLPLYEGRTCMASGFNYTDTCEMGGYPTYVVNATNVAQIQLAVNMARNLNLRLVVKNTGHDFNGKASGRGALSIWTHWFKDKAFHPHFNADSGYSGPAIKFGAGVQVFEAYEFGKANDVSVVGGEGSTVGLGGGYTAGGGHSPLSSMYGMAADQVLAIEVVVADGRFITATPKQHADIFWMLCGGGGSTIGVVTSLTVKAMPKLPTTTVTFNFTINDVPSADAFWAAVESYLDNFEDFVNAGTYGYYYVGASKYMIGTAYRGSTDYYFRMNSFVAPNMSVCETKKLLAPWFERLDSLNVSYTPWYNHADNFHDVWVPAFPQEGVGTAVVKTASRLMPRRVFQDDDARKQTFLAHQDAIHKGLFIAGFHISGTGIAVSPPEDIAVLPAWRKALAHVIVGGQWNSTSPWDVVANTTLHVTHWMDALRGIAPDSGAYMSEADLLEPNLQQAFYGDNYPRLYELKQRYDPTGVFFALTAVGAEDWVVKVVEPVPDGWNTDGRLCRVG